MKKQDGRKNANVTKGNVHKMEWIDSDYLTHFIKKVIGYDRTLNLCSGMSPIGDVRGDIDPETNRTMDLNLFDAKNVFRENQFPFVIVDPPDCFYNPGCKEIADRYYTKSTYYKSGKVKMKYGDPYEWQYELLDIASKALILQRPLIMTNWGGVSKFQEYFLIRDSRPMGRILEIIWK